MLIDILTAKDAEKRVQPLHGPALSPTELRVDTRGQNALSAIASPFRTQSLKQRSISCEPTVDTQSKRLFKAVFGQKLPKTFFSLFQNKAKETDKVAKATRVEPPANDIVESYNGLKTNYGKLYQELDRAQNESKDAASFGGQEIVNQLAPLPPEGEVKSFDDLKQAYAKLNASMNKAVEVGALPANEIDDIKLKETSLKEKPESLAPVQLKKGHTIVADTLRVMTKQINSVEKMVREYLGEIEKRNRGMSDLDRLKQHLRNSPENLNWQQDPEVIRLIDRAKELGVMVPSADTWGEKEKSILFQGIDDVKTGLINVNETDNFKLTLCQNNLKMFWELLSDLMKVYMNILEHFARNLPTR